MTRDRRDLVLGALAAVTVTVAWAMLLVRMIFS